MTKLLDRKVGGWTLRRHLIEAGFWGGLGVVGGTWMFHPHMFDWIGGLI